MRSEEECAQQWLQWKFRTYCPVKRLTEELMDDVAVATSRARDITRRSERSEEGVMNLWFGSAVRRAVDKSDWSSDAVVEVWLEAWKDWRIQRLGGAGGGVA